MNILLWIIFGGLVGWLASKIIGTDEEQGIVANVIVGIVGALIGGFIMQRLGRPHVTGFNLSSFIVALLGALLLLIVLKILF